MPSDIRAKHPAGQPAVGFDYTKIMAECSSYLVVFALMSFAMMLPSFNRMMNHWTGGYHIILFYIATLFLRFYQHAPHGQPVSRDPDIAFICRITKGGKCCHFSDMCFWARKREDKKWSLTEDEVESRTARGGFRAFKADEAPVDRCECGCNMLLDSDFEDEDEE